ncbi:MAG: DUF4333 domain-containing protein [Acidobacteria bacterium]|nr:DUF4333 domain-containing protein [Acidobacteriota bacterium]
MRINPARLLTGFAFVGLMAGVVACGTTLDMGAIGKSVTEGVQSQLSLPVASVTCPTETRAAKAGDTFECTAIPKDGGKLTVKVTQNDDKGNVKWEVVKMEGLTDLKLVEEAVMNGLKEQAGIDATITCGAKYRATKAGESFDCQAKSADKGDATVTVTMKDTEGHISWAVKQ